MNMKLSSVDTCPFTDGASAINYYINNNPARLKSFNLLEPCGKLLTAARAPYSSSDLWAAVVCAIEAAQKHSTKERRLAFYYYYIERTALVDIATRLRTSRRTVRRWLNESLDDLETELYIRGLMPKPERY